MQVGSSELSEYLGITQRRVQQLANEKVLTKDARNSYLLKDNIHKYISYISPKFKSEDDNVDEDELNVQMKKEKVNLTKHQAREQKVKADLAEKKVISVEEVKHTLANLFALMRTKLLNVPDRAELELLGETDSDVFNKKLTAEIKDAMYEVCEGVDDVIDKVTQQEEEEE